MGDFIGQTSLLTKIDERKGISYFRFKTGKDKSQHHFGTTGHRNTGSGQLVPIEISKKNHICDTFLGSGKKPKVKARAAELNAEPELFQFIANITYLIKSKSQKYHILRNQHENLS